jgi:hypothetical protein
MYRPIISILILIVLIVFAMYSAFDIQLCVGLSTNPCQCKINSLFKTNLVPLPNYLPLHSIHLHFCLLSRNILLGSIVWTYLALKSCTKRLTKTKICTLERRPAALVAPRLRELDFSVTTGIGGHGTVSFIKIGLVRPY